MKSLIDSIVDLRQKVFNKEKMMVETYEKLQTREEIIAWLDNHHVAHTPKDINEDLTIDIHIGNKFNNHYLLQGISFLPFKASKDSTKNWLDSQFIHNYIINEDLSVDVMGDVNFSGKNLEFIPIQFGVIDGNFDCSNTNLQNTQGFPKKVKGSVDISGTSIKSLHGMTEDIGQSFYCSNNKELFSLKYGPAKVNKTYVISYTPINNLEDFSCNIGGNLYSVYDLEEKRGCNIQELKDYYIKAKDHNPNAYKNNQAMLVEISGELLNNTLQTKKSHKVTI